MRKVLGLLIVLASVFVLFGYGEVRAQSCQGNVVCGNSVRIPGTCSGNGSSCLSDNQCPLGQTCQGVTRECQATAPGSCFLSGGPGGICLHTCTCVSSGGCSLVNPPPPPPPPTPPPPTPPPPPGSCTGGSSCFIGIGNCGAVGRVNGSGSCPGGLCCATAPVNNPGTCWVDFQPDRLVVVAEGDLSSQITMRPRGQNVRFQSVTFSSANNGIANATRGTVAITNANRNVNFRIRGRRVGNTTIRARVTAQGGETCSNYLPVQVIPGGSKACTIDVPSSMSVAPGATEPLLVSIVSETGGSIDRVRFTSDANNTIRPNPRTDNTGPVFSTDLEGRQAGTANILVEAYMSTFNPVCTDTISINGLSSSAWWQVQGGGATAASGALQSLIPATCTGACDPNFIVDGAGGYPGVGVYGGGSTNFQDGQVSSQGWVGNAGYSGADFDFEYFDKIKPSSVSNNSNISGSINNGSLNSGQNINGVRWSRSSGDITISNPINVPANRRNVIFVDGNLNINNTVGMANISNSFVMFIVSGDIVVDPSVSNGANPAIEGIYVADGVLRTGAGSEQLVFLGSMVAHGGVILERDLGVGNNTAPAETFIHSADLLFNYPTSLSPKRVVWTEVAP